MKYKARSELCTDPLWAVDFASEALAEGLYRHGVQLDAPVFLAWLGVTMFLTAADAAACYFANRTDGLPAPHRATIVRAVRDAPRPRDDLLSETP